MEILDNIIEYIKQFGDHTRESIPFHCDKSINDKLKPSEGKQRRCVTLPHTAPLQHLLNLTG